MAVAMLHSLNDNEWTEEELSPVKKITISDVSKSGSVLSVDIVLNDGSKYEIDFKDIDGFKSC